MRWLESCLLLVAAAVLLSWFSGCGGSAGDAQSTLKETQQIGDAIVKITKVELTEWDPDAKRLSKREKPHNTLRIEMVIVKAFRGKPIKYHGWIDRKSKADSKNYATLSDSKGSSYRLIRGSGPGSVGGSEYDGRVALIQDSRSEHLIFRLPLETEPVLDLQLSGWAFKQAGEMNFRIPVENWTYKD